ncbi:MAG: AI-2E family transporter [Pseudomonadales bacterium]|nr:AI-2E family transporter [Pseudomonadales bacterium]
MLKLAQLWYTRYFSNQEAIILLLLLVVGFSVVLSMGVPLAPVLTSIVLAYLLQGAVNFFIRKGLPRMPSIVLSYALFLTMLGAFLFVLVPLTWGQLIRLIKEQMPMMINQANEQLIKLPEQYPEFVSEEWVTEITALTTTALKDVVETVLTFSLANIPNLMAVLIFLVLVPLLVFFFLKDKDEMIGWFVGFLPDDRPFIRKVTQEMDEQISNYVRGKAIEILVVGIATYIGLVFFGVNYSALLGLLVGLSVVIPYIGAAVVTVPVTMVAYFQFGWGGEFFWVMMVYGIIQGLDGNLLVPLLFSEAVNLHPVAIITAVLLFGGMWGVWGVFFAIPLATLVKAVMLSLIHI